MNFADKGAVSHNEHFGVWFHAVAAAQAEHDKIIGLVDGQNRAADADLSSRQLSPLLLVVQLGRSLSDRLDLFKKKTFLALGVVELLPGIIELGLQIDGGRCSWIGGRRLLFLDLLL